MENNRFYKVVKSLLNVLFNFCFRPTVVGKENVLMDESVVLAGNHTRWLDPLMLITVVDRQVHFLAKEELFHGFTKPFLKGCGAIPVNRKIHDKDALVHAKECLEFGTCVGIFPEGTINKTKDVIMPFKIGAVKMAKDTKTKIVPFIITGKYKLFRKSIRIEFLKPISIEKELDFENDRLMNIISSNLIKNK